MKFLNLSNKIFVGCIALFLAITVVSCEKDFDIDVKPNEPQLVVEAYINNMYPEYNYVVLSRSQNYFSPDFQSIPVTDATVTITEGELNPDNTYNWNTSSKVQLKEIGLPQLPANFKSGVYFDPRLNTNPSQALKGTIGKLYLLEVTEGGRQYTAVTRLLQPVKLDSLTTGYPFIDEDDSSKQKLRVTMHYQEPDTLGNAQFYFWRGNENRANFGWGGLGKARIPGNDDLTNGQYLHITHPRGFVVGDTVTYYLTSVTRDVNRFWDSFNRARDNNGPFATPIVLKTNISGNNVTGCFSGFSMDAKTIVIK